VLDRLFLLLAHSAPSFLSFHPIAVFSLLVPTSKFSHPFFCLFHSLSLSGISLDSLILSLLSCLFVFVPFTQLYIHPSSFCSQYFHFFTGVLVPLVVFLSLFLLSVFLFSLQNPALFPSIHVVLKFCRSLSRSHSHSIPLALFPHYVTSCTLPTLCNLAFLCSLLAPLSNIFLALSLPLLIPSIPRSLPSASISSLSCSQISSFSS
jgi:hypothetical protein